MSSCLVLQQRNSLFIASDTAISSISNGERIRVSNDGNKLFKKDNALIFCSGKMKMATKCRKYIEKMNSLNIDEIQDFVSRFYIEGLFEIFIGIVENDMVKTYQLSSYNNFNPIERIIPEKQTEIFALGFNTKNMLDGFEKYLKQTDVITSIKNTFNDNICVEVGGNLDVMYYFDGLTSQFSYALKDTTKCLIDTFNEESCHFVVADTLIGKVILGEELFIGNGDNTFKILPEGLYVYDQSSSHELRVFLGIKDGKAKLELYSSSGDNSLVLSEEGIYSCYQISDRDSFDYYNSFKSHFYVPSTLEKTFEAKLVVRLEKFRAYSKASASETINLQSTNSETINLKSTNSETINLKSTNSGGGSTTTSGGSGNISVSLSGATGSSGGTSVSGSGNSTSTSGTAWSNGGTTTGSPLGSANGDQANIDMSSHYHWVKLIHNHGVSVNCGSHSHSISISGSASASTHSHSVAIPDHSHSITMPSHNHSITMPSHDHDLIYGIFEHGTIPSCRVYLNGIDLGVTMNAEREYSIDITNQFKGLQQGLNTIEIKTTDANGLARASFTMFWGGYFSYY